MTWYGCSIYLSAISNNSPGNLALSDTFTYLSLQMFALLCDHNPGNGGNVCMRLTSVHGHQHIQRTVIILPFSPLWEIWIFLMYRVGSCVRMFTQRSGWQHRSCPYGMIFGKSFQSQVPCMTWDIIMKWVMLERRSDPFRNLLPVSEIFISVSFDKNSRKKEGR